MFFLSCDREAMSLFHHNNRHESNRSRQQPLSKENSASAAAGHSTTPAESGSERHSNENERPSSLFGRFRGEGMKHLSALHDDQREHDVSSTESGTIHLQKNHGNQDHHDAVPVRPSVEPKQPTNIPDALEHTLESISKHSDADGKADHQEKPSHGRKTGLTKADIKYLFSGAPHFILEKGRHNLWYPHAIFPWDLHDPTVHDLWDRQPLRHESFTLSTLHAHLPVPDNWALGGSSKAQKTVEDQKTTRDGAARRSTFDIGVFEVPNMLSINGKEPGCVGFRHFLEIPVADRVQNKPSVPKPAVDRSRLAQLPAYEAFDIIQHLGDPYSECNKDTVLDRHKLICEGPPAWKCIGVREVHVKTIVDRLEELGKFRTDILRGGKTITILDKESPDILYRNLYTNFLYPPPPTKVTGHRDLRSLKAQIEVLTRVLAVKGAWVDFSLVEWRLRVGQILWEMPPHADGDCVELKHAVSSEDDRRRQARLEQGAERTWLLLQLLLAAELLVRLDAVVRLGILEHSKDMTVTPHEVEHLDKLRHGKVNWDLVFVQRFFDNLTVKYCPPSAPPQSPPSSGGHQGSPQKPRRQSFLSRIGSFRHHHQHEDIGCAWDCVISPRRAEQQLQGLLVFADMIGWPERDRLEETIRSKLQMREKASNLEAASAVYSSPIRNERPLILGKKEMYRKSPSRQLVVLHESGGSAEADMPADLGGWLSRSWLAGLVLPGEAISHFLMATILENDKKAMAKLGPMANLHGGFAYAGRSWWSTRCIVARVLTALGGSAACMGWARIGVLPRDAAKGQVLENTWFEVDVKSVPSSPTTKKPRIHQGTRVALESNPLGRGEVSANTFSIPVDIPPSSSDNKEEIAFRELTLSLSTVDERPPLVKGITAAREASVSFDLSTTDGEITSTTITFPLRYDVHFISSYTCRPPRGYVARNGSSDQEQHDHDHHHHHPHLPGHPLHNSYTYKYVPLTSLRPDMPAPLSSTSEHEKEHHHSEDNDPAHAYSHHHNHNDNNDNTRPQEQEPVWILDARGSRDKEAFARAWCASAGTSAIIGRVGRTCLACCIREARAVDVGVVIRVD
ncbi:hypothetical protein VTN96DRAFT_4387 [Rasamsonia emersonii]